MDAVEMKKVYKFFSFTTFSARDEAHFNKDFEDYTFEGMAGHGSKIVIVGSRMEPVLPEAEPEVEADVEELTPVGAFSDEVDEVESKPKIVDPFRQ